METGLALSADLLEKLSALPADQKRILIAVLSAELEGGRQRVPDRAGDAGIAALQGTNWTTQSAQALGGDPTFPRSFVE